MIFLGTHISPIVMKFQRKINLCCLYHVCAICFVRYIVVLVWVLFVEFFFLVNRCKIHYLNPLWVAFFSCWPRFHSPTNFIPPLGILFYCWVNLLHLKKIYTPLGYFLCVGHTNWEASWSYSLLGCFYLVGCLPFTPRSFSLDAKCLNSLEVIFS